eukprot:tig00001374_g8511.t1
MADYTGDYDRSPHSDEYGGGDSSRFFTVLESARMRRANAEAPSSPYGSASGNMPRPPSRPGSAQPRPPSRGRSRPVSAQVRGLPVRARPPSAGPARRPPSAGPSRRPHHNDPESLLESMERLERQLKSVEREHLLLKAECMQAEYENQRKERQIDDLLDTQARMFASKQATQVRADTNALRETKAEVKHLEAILAEKEDTLQGMREDMKPTRVAVLELEVQGLFDDSRRLAKLVEMNAKLAPEVAQTAEARIRDMESFSYLRLKLDNRALRQENRTIAAEIQGLSAEITRAKEDLARTLEGISGEQRRADAQARAEAEAQERARREAVRAELRRKAAATRIGAAFRMWSVRTRYLRQRDERRRAEEARRKAAEDARRKAEEDKRKAEEAARRKAEEEAARKGAEEEAKRRADEEAAKKRAEEEAKRKAEEEEAKRKAAEEEAKRKAEEEAKKKAEEEAAKKRAEEEAAKQKAEAEAEAKRKAEEEAAAAKKKAEEEAAKKADKEEEKYEDDFEAPAPAPAAEAPRPKLPAGTPPMKAGEAVTVAVVAGRSLVAKQSDGKSHPYVMVYAGRNMAPIGEKPIRENEGAVALGESKPKYTTLDPEWGYEEAEAYVAQAPAEEVLVVEVWCWARFLAPKYMGEVRVRLDELGSGAALEGWFPMETSRPLATKPEDLAKSALHLRLTAGPPPPKKEEPAPAPEPEPPKEPPKEEPPQPAAPAPAVDPDEELRKMEEELRRQEEELAAQEAELQEQEEAMRQEELELKLREEQTRSIKEQQEREESILRLREERVKKFDRIVMACVRAQAFVRGWRTRRKLRAEGKSVKVPKAAEGEPAKPSEPAPAAAAADESFKRREEEIRKQEEEMRQQEEEMKRMEEELRRQEEELAAQEAELQAQEEQQRQEELELKLREEKERAAREEAQRQEDILRLRRERIVRFERFVMACVRSQAYFRGFKARRKLRLEEASRRRMEALSNAPDEAELKRALEERQRALDAAAEAEREAARPEAAKPEAEKPAPAPAPAAGGPTPEELEEMRRQEEEVRRMEEEMRRMEEELAAQEAELQAQQEAVRADEAALKLHEEEARVRREETERQAEILRLREERVKKFDRFMMACIRIQALYRGYTTRKRLAGKAAATRRAEALTNAPDAGSLAKLQEEARLAQEKYDAVLKEEMEAEAKGA